MLELEMEIEKETNRTEKIKKKIFVPANLLASIVPYNIQCLFYIRESLPRSTSLILTPLMIQQLLLHITNILRIRVTRTRRYTHPIPQLLRRQTLRQFKQRTQHCTNMIRCNLIWTHRSIIPLSSCWVKPNLGCKGSDECKFMYIEMNKKRKIPTYEILRKGLQTPHQIQAVHLQSFSSLLFPLLLGKRLMLV